VDSDANSTGLKVELDLSIWYFQRSFYTYRRPFWQTPVLRRFIPENRRVGGLLMRIGDANFTQLNTPLNLSIRRVSRSLYTYRKVFWPSPVARRCILGNRSPGGCGCDLVLQWRCKFHSIECTLEPINTALSTKPLHI
jgi:hypothetical protein